VIQLARKLSLFLPFLAFVAWINWTVDPAMLFGDHLWDPARHRYEGMIAGDLLAEKPHTTVAPYNERLVDEMIFHHRPQIETLVLGSSLAKPIYAGLCPGKCVYNASIYGGRLDEMVGAYELARRSGLHVRRLVLQFNTGFLADRKGRVDEQFASLAREARARLQVGVNESDGHDPIWRMIWDTLFPGEEAQDPLAARAHFHDYSTLVSPRYFQLSIHSLAESLPAGDALPIRYRPGDGHLLYPDGSVEWAPNWRAKTQATLHQRAPKDLMSLSEAEYLRPAPLQSRLLESFLADALGSGAQVEFVLTPTNPWMYEYARAEFHRRGLPLPSSETEELLRSFARRYGIPVHGSLDVARTAIKEEDFVDYFHIRREAIHRLWGPTSGGPLTSAR
jgi:hypothetical protein